MHSLKHILFGLGMLSLVAATSAASQSVSASAPITIVNALQASGLPTQARTADGQAPVIETQLDGVSFVVLLNNCSNGLSCQDMQFRASFQAEAFSTDALNAWNQQTFIGKAYKDAQGNVVLEHAMVGVDGMSRFTFQRTLIGWQAALNGFRTTFAAPATQSE